VINEPDALRAHARPDGVPYPIPRSLAGDGVREALQVLGRLMEGRNLHDIAVLFVVSEATVRIQVKSILAKPRVSSQLAAVGLAHQVGWPPPES